MYKNKLKSLVILFPGLKENCDQFCERFYKALRIASYTMHDDNMDFSISLEDIPYDLDLMFFIMTNYNNFEQINHSINFISKKYSINRIILVLPHKDIRDKWYPLLSEINHVSNLDKLEIDGCWSEIHDTLKKNNQYPTFYIEDNNQDNFIYIIFSIIYYKNNYCFN